ncbi:hypothetical protein QBZ16_004842 [Prototheca wickerhamii]|uniref:Endonuclease/exonuclease/phosphatase domain-containing protein n=1 Tax=Prototheca wickerhamii TaxID=3111 RepID=A0AAD9MKY7_PROWI|nr:hypothetical protein QBZ16_004842 [Prototheca wickerhamii]
MAGPYNVVAARLSPDTPVCGVPLEPYVLARRADSSTVTGAEGATDSRFSIKYRWYRSVVTKTGQVCWVHPDREATVQCILCLRSRADQRKSYHCSAACLKEHWCFHREFHRNPGRGQHDASSGDLARSLAAAAAAQGGGAAAAEAWVEVSSAAHYTPSFEDVGSVLKLECVAYDAASPYPEIGKVPEAHPCTPPWALGWSYRAPNLLREILACEADVLCLQEVQSNAFYDFWAPQLAEAGYAAVFKKKTAEMFSKNSYVTDGCATFFRKDRFSLVKKYEVEFNKAALSLADAFPPEQKKLALSRLLKDNVALIAVLEALDPAPEEGAEDARRENGRGARGAAAPRRQLLCVANTHIHSNPELSDVKTWQVQTLLKGLEKIAASADIPILLAGDFNTVPGSAAHQLLVRGAVAPGHAELAHDPLGILRPPSKLQHGLPLASAYAAVASVPPQGDSLALARQRRRLDPETGEPRFTNFTRDFKGTLDYILYTSDSLIPTATLELMDESEVRLGPEAGLPSEVLSSDHLALAVTFQYAAPAGEE